MSQPETRCCQRCQCKSRLGSQAKGKGFFHIKDLLPVDSNKQGKRGADPVPAGQVTHIMQYLRPRAWEKIEDSIQTQENVSAPEYLPIYPVSKGGQEQVPEQSTGMGQVSSSTHQSPIKHMSVQGLCLDLQHWLDRAVSCCRGLLQPCCMHPDPSSHCCWSHPIRHVFQLACPHPLLPMLQSLSTSDKQDISLWPGACPGHAGSSLLLKTSSGSH